MGMVIQMFVYFIQGKITRFVKIGWTVNPDQRLAGMQANSPDKLTLLKVIKGDIPYEKHLHKQFASIRNHGEWFYPSRGLMAFIQSLKGLKTNEILESIAILPKRSLSKEDTLRNQILQSLTQPLKTSEILNAVSGHPTAIKNELKRLFGRGCAYKSPSRRLHTERRV